MITYVPRYWVSICKGCQEYVHFVTTILGINLAMQSLIFKYISWNIHSPKKRVLKKQLIVRIHHTRILFFFCNGCFITHKNRQFRKRFRLSLLQATGTKLMYIKNISIRTNYFRNLHQCIRWYRLYRTQLFYTIRVTKKKATITQTKLLLDVPTAISLEQIHLMHGVRESSIANHHKQLTWSW